MKHYLVALTFVLLSAGVNTQAQTKKNYIYGSLKLPALTYLESALKNEEELDNGVKVKDGLILDLGYGYKAHQYLLLEAGVELHLLGDDHIKYPHGDFSNFPYDELSVNISSLAFQFRPVFKYDIGEGNYLRLGCGFNYKTLYTSGKYEINKAATNGQRLNKVFTARASAAKIDLQPVLGAVFELSDKWLLGFDFSYVQTDWNKSLSKLHFNKYPDIIAPDHKVSTVFLSIRVVFQ